VESVRKGLQGHLRQFDEAERETLVFGAIHHLGTRIGGLTSSGAAVTDVLSTLHPTAGVAGTPRDEALDLIREIEPRSRGRYAGPVGWFADTGEGEFAVALRCGLFEGSRVILHAGGGIVEGSDRDEEFEETEIKLAPMLSALGG
jgi:menaquinone-specific isochorismate synthase